MDKTIYKTFPLHCVRFLFAASGGERVGIEPRPIAGAYRVKRQKDVEILFLLQAPGQCLSEGKKRKQVEEKQQLGEGD